ncbi:PLAC8-like protein 1 isoform X2 [Lates japonicus]|uniref:PLAC8-like protein 1 isoform X2 n=1 Tax=Lates japonicus TaxID=270547 RepID=A0AAD3M330_LATJO|nr:PLAC8-like protein 1 isoform X2 [Lates japonicus]
MEQTTVTHQPELSATEASASAFREKEMGGFATASEGNWRSDNSPAAMDPILTQPGLGVTTTTITTITQTGGDWSTGLFDICGDKTTCILGALVPCCLDLSLAHQYGECLCMPLLPGSTFAIRVGIRERYKIQFGCRNQKASKKQEETQVHLGMQHNVPNVCAISAWTKSSHGTASSVVEMSLALGKPGRKN